MSRTIGVVRVLIALIAFGSMCAIVLTRESLSEEHAMELIFYMTAAYFALLFAIGVNVSTIFPKSFEPIYDQRRNHPPE